MAKRRNKTLGVIVFIVLLFGFAAVLQMPDKTTSANDHVIESSGIKYEEIYRIEGGLLTLFIQTETVDKEIAQKLAKAFVSQYGDKLSQVHMFDKSQAVQPGEKPNLTKVDPVATYTNGDKQITIYAAKDKIEQFPLD